jgi:pectate lyase
MPRRRLWPLAHDLPLQQLEKSWHTRNFRRFGTQHLYNNYYKDFCFQAIHSRSDNQILVEGNVFTGDIREKLSTYGLVIPEYSPNISFLGDYEIDGAATDFGDSGVNITRVGNFRTVPYAYTLTPCECSCSSG